MTKKTRCNWANPKNPLYLKYHDEELGVPVHDDQKLFEMIILEGAQAGLSWETVLNKREGYRKAFKNFDIMKISKMTDAQLEKLMFNEAIIRNRLKIYSTRKNALVFLEIQKEFGSFDKYAWSFVKGKTIKNKWKDHKNIPATTKESDAFAQDLKKRAMSFVGSTIIYAFMQATGMVNDHSFDCFRYKQCK